MLSEFQSYVIGYCIYCGTECLACDDWDREEWADPAPDCPGCTLTEDPCVDLLHDRSAQETQMNAIDDYSRWFWERYDRIGDNHAAS